MVIHVACLKKNFSFLVLSYNDPIDYHINSVTLAYQCVMHLKVKLPVFSFFSGDKIIGVSVDLFTRSFHPEERRDLS